MTFVSYIARTAFDERHVEKLEKWIDTLDEALPPLTTFILPVSGYPMQLVFIPQLLSMDDSREVKAVLAFICLELFVGEG